MSVATIIRTSRWYVLFGSTLLLAVTVLALKPHLASAAACTAPTTDYGNVSGLSVSLPATTTYRIWTRMAAADTSNNTYLLEVDGSSCYTVGGASVPTYTSAQDTAGTRFASGTTNWISKTSSGTQIDVSLTAGTHTLKLIGNAAGVVVDRLILTQDTACVPTGVGDNCANPPDTTPPVVAVSAPTDNSTISTVTTVTATATDDVAVSRVEIYVDGTLKATDTSSPYTYSFDPTTYSIGAHQLTAKAYDAAGNAATSTIIHVTVADTVKPVVTITAPAGGSTQSGTFVATATATDNVAVTKVEFYLDGTLKTTITTGTSPYSGSVDVSAVANGTHSLTAKAYDAANNNTTSTAVSITVSNTSGGTDTTPPTVAVTAPAASAIQNNNAGITFTATAADASGIKQVVFKIDGTTVGSAITTSPYSYAMPSSAVSALACGSHTVTATATDNATGANVAVSAGISFWVTYPQDMNTTPDCHINYLDLSVLASKYNQSTNVGRADINKDGTVNYLDLSSLAGAYNSH